MHVLVIVLLLATACGGSGSGTEDDGAAPGRTLDPAQRAASIEAAKANEPNLVLSDDVRTTQLLDTADGSIRTLDDVVTGDRAVLLWYWAPH